MHHERATDPYRHPAALLYYDFVLTIPQEVERYWERKFSLPSFLFFLNRYMSVLCHIPVIIEFFGVIPESVSPICLPNAR